MVCYNSNSIGIGLYLSYFPFYSWYVIIETGKCSEAIWSYFPFYSWYVIIKTEEYAEPGEVIFPFLFLVCYNQSASRVKRCDVIFPFLFLVCYNRVAKKLGFSTNPSFFTLKNHMISSKFMLPFSSFFVVPNSIFIEEYCLSVRTNILTEPVSGRFSFRRPSCFLTASIPLHTRTYTEYCNIQYPSFNRNLRKLYAHLLSFFVFVGISKNTINLINLLIIMSFQLYQFWDFKFILITHQNRIITCYHFIYGMMYYMFFSMYIHVIIHNIHQLIPHLFA